MTDTYRCGHQRTPDNTHWQPKNGKRYPLCRQCHNEQHARRRREARAGLRGTACSIEGCPRGVESRGWCGNHYRQWHRTGSPYGVRGKQLPPDELARLRAAVGARPEASERAS